MVDAKIGGRTLVPATYKITLDPNIGGGSIALQESWVETGQSVIINLKTGQLVLKAQKLLKLPFLQVHV